MGDLARVITTQRVSVLIDPCSELCGAQGRSIHIQPTFHQAPDLLAGDDDISHEQSNNPAAPIDKLRVNMDDGSL
jgi:hypothetical protein